MDKFLDKKYKLVRVEKTEQKLFEELGETLEKEMNFDAHKN
jgi:hypothetical protein